MTLPLRSLAVVALASLALVPAAPRAVACTTAVVSREASATGRAMLWKNRDADGSDNQVVLLNDGKYPYVGLVNRGDTMGLQIWAGVNTAGFAIMNSASYNLESGDTAGEGTLMKLALQTCATVEEFEALLAKSNSGGRDVSANFGVVDAKGGAVTFETGKTGYVRFDATAANDGAKGLLVRSNYSHSGGKDAGSGFLREARGIELLGPLAASGKLDARTIMGTAARDVTNAAIGSTGAETGPPLVYTADSVCRLDTVSAVVLEAPAAGEGPEAAAMWIVPSLPVTGVAVPIFPAAGAVPDLLSARKEAAPLVAGSLVLRGRLYPETRGEKKRYMNRAALGFVRAEALPLLLAAEEQTFREVESARAAWRKASPSAASMKALSEAAAARALKAVDAAEAAVAAVAAVAKAAASR